MYLLSVVRVRPDTDECAADPCVNAHECIDVDEDYECLCLPGYSGKDCEVSECVFGIFGHH